MQDTQGAIGSAKTLRVLYQLYKEVIKINSMVCLLLRVVVLLHVSWVIGVEEVQVCLPGTVYLCMD